MPRTEETNQRIRNEQRDRILQAARKVFARKGMAATVDDIAAYAGVSHGLAYRYFANKTALFSELVIQDLQVPAEWLEQFEDDQGAPKEKIRQMVTGFVESRRNYPERYQLLAQVLNDESASDELRQRIKQRGQLVRGILRKLIIAGQACGEVVSDNPEQLVRAIFAALEGLTARPINDLPTYQADFPDAEIFLRMLKP